MNAKPGTTQWRCLKCGLNCTTIMEHVLTVKCLHCGGPVKAAGMTGSKVQGRGQFFQQNIGLDILMNLQKGDAKVMK